MKHVKGFHTSIASDRPSRSGGFTLVELLVVIGIIAVLVGILMPVLTRARKAANDIVCAANIRTLTQGCMIYAAENRNWLPPSYGTTQGQVEIINAGNRPYGLAFMVLKKLATPKQLYSPSDILTYAVDADLWTRVTDPNSPNYEGKGLSATDIMHTSYLLREPQALTGGIGADPNAWNQVSGHDPLFRVGKVRRYACVADRFWAQNTWSFHGGIYGLANKAGSPYVKDNGRGWHVGYTDGSVDFQTNDFEHYNNTPSTYNNPDKVPQPKGWDTRYRAWIMWDFYSNNLGKLTNIARGSDT